MTSPAPGVYLPGNQANPSARTSEAIGRPADRRTGTVVAFAAGVLTVSVGGGDPEDVGYLNSYSPVVGDVVALILQRSTWLCIGRINDSDALLPPWSESVQIIASPQSITSTTFVDVTAVSFTFVKRRAESRIFGMMAGSGFVTVAGVGGEFGARFDSTDYMLARKYWNVINSHESWSGFRHLSGIPAGTYTVQGRFRVYTAVGGGNLQHNVDDVFSLYCAEVD